LTKHEIASLSLKILGIYSIIQAVPLLQPIGMYLTTFRHLADKPISPVSIFLGSALPPIILILLGTFLIIFSSRLAGRLISDDATGTALSAMSGLQIQALVFSVLGVAVFVMAIPKLVQIGTNLAVLNHAETKHEAERILRHTWPHITAVIVQLLIGVGLFLGGKGLAKFWHHLREDKPFIDDS